MTKLKTYEVYVISCGVKSLILRTTKKKDAIQKYTVLVSSNQRPRVSIDGEQLTICEADKNFNKANLRGRKQ